MEKGGLLLPPAGGKPVGTGFVRDAAVNLGRYTSVSSLGNMLLGFLYDLDVFFFFFF